MEGCVRVFGFRFGNYHWVHVVVAGGTVGLAGCTDRTIDYALAGGGDPDTDTDGTDPTDTDRPDPTVDPTDPTGDPTDPLPGVPGPPQLISVSFVDNQTLSLAFNEPMSTPNTLDPMAFRLSIGSGSDGTAYYPYQYYAWTDYIAPHYYNGTEVCGEYCWPCYKYDPYCNGRYYCYDYCYNQPGPPVRTLTLESDPNDATRILLRLDNGLGSGVCNALELFGPNYTRGLFLHYSDAYGPMFDTQGEVLASIGPHWANAPDENFAYTPGEFFPELIPFLPIPCPF